MLKKYFKKKKIINKALNYSHNYREHKKPKQEPKQEPDIYNISNSYYKLRNFQPSDAIIINEITEMIASDPLFTPLELTFDFDTTLNDEQRKEITDILKEKKLPVLILYYGYKKYLIYFIDEDTGKLVKPNEIYAELEEAIIKLSSDATENNLVGDIAIDFFVLYSTKTDTELEKEIEQEPGILLFENFEKISLKSFSETSIESALEKNKGKDWSQDPPEGWLVTYGKPDAGGHQDNGVPEFNGWTFMKISTWNHTSGQGRIHFQGNKNTTIAIADSDEYADINDANFNSQLFSKIIDVTDVTKVKLTFNSSWWYENDNQKAAVYVFYDNDVNITYKSGKILDNYFMDIINSGLDNSNNCKNCLQNISNNGNTGMNCQNLSGDSQHCNNIIKIKFNIPVEASKMRIMWHYQGKNNWWWAIDNIKIKQEPESELESESESESDPEPEPDPEPDPESESINKNFYLIILVIIMVIYFLYQFLIKKKSINKIIKIDKLKKEIINMIN